MGFFDKNSRENIVGGGEYYETQSTRKKTEPRELRKMQLGNKVTVFEARSSENKGVNHSQDAVAVAYLGDYLVVALADGVTTGPENSYFAKSRDGQLYGGDKSSAQFVDGVINSNLKEIFLDNNNHDFSKIIGICAILFQNGANSVVDGTGTTGMVFILNKKTGEFVFKGQGTEAVLAIDQKSRRTILINEPDKAKVEGYTAAILPDTSSKGLAEQYQNYKKGQLLPNQSIVLSTDWTTPDKLRSFIDTNPRLAVGEVTKDMIANIKGYLDDVTVVEIKLK